MTLSANHAKQNLPVVVLPSTATAAVPAPRGSEMPCAVTDTTPGAGFMIGLLTGSSNFCHFLA